jgi:hypothetical protein
MKATKSQSIVVIIALSVIGAIVLAQEKLTYLFTDPFEVSHIECAKIGNQTCGSISVSGRTLRSLINDSGYEEQTVLDLNNWKQRMLDERVPARRNFKLRALPDPFAVSKQNCIDKGWMKGKCKFAPEILGVLPMQFFLDDSRATIEDMRLVNNWGIDVTAETLVPVDSWFAYP